MLPRRTVSRLGALGTALALVAVALAPLHPSPVAAAGPFVVDTTTDTVDASPGNGACADAGGSCSLRAAIQETNALAGADTITLPAGTYPLTRAGRGENAAAIGDLDVAGVLTLTGVGSPSIVGGGLDRLFEIRSGGLTVDGVVMTGGNPGAAAGGAILSTHSTSLTLTNATVDGNTSLVGAGIAAVGVVAISDSAVTNNVATRDGGGLFMLGTGSIDVETSTIANNTATRYGGGMLTMRGASFTGVTIDNNTSTIAGGLFAGGTGTLAITDSYLTDNTAAIVGGLYAAEISTLTVTGSHITGNTATQANALGGGILAEVPTTIDTTQIADNDADIGGGVLAVDALTVTRSTIDHNNADVVAGGLGAIGPSLAITNSTISTNTTAGFAGGLGIATTATLTNVTIADNIATTGGSGIYTFAPGEAGTAGGTTTLTSSILGPQVIGPDCGGGGSTTSTGDNISADATCNLAGAGDQPSTDPLLGPLANNGGPTPTHQPQATSPALDTVSPGINGCGTTLTLDQRGLPRPQNGACDTGAVESQDTTVSPGGGRNFLGTANDPADAVPAAYHENFWLAVSGPCASAENGAGLEAITDGTYWHEALPHDTNPGVPGASVSWQGCQATNSEVTTDGTAGDLYDPDGYFYAIDVPIAAEGNDLAIDIWDPADCTNGNSGGEYTTTYTIRGPDADDLEPTDNPIYDQAAFPSNSTSTVGGARACNDAGGTNWENQWRTLATVANADAGTYFVQVQTAGGITPSGYHTSNSFSLRAHYDGTWSSASSPCSGNPNESIYSPDCPTIESLGWIGVLANLTAAQPQFLLNTPSPLPAAGSVVIEVFDPGEGARGLEILDPLGRSVSFDWEVVNRSGADVAPTGGFSGTVSQAGGVPCTLPPPGCEELDVLGTPNTYSAPTSANYWRGWNPQMLPYRGSRSKYSDRLLRLTVQLPTSPSVEYWGQTHFRIRYTMGDVDGANTDRTMWRVSVHEAPLGS